VMMELVTKARDLFFSYGLKSVSMDDLARMSCTSKKTIYQHVADKNELVDRVVEDLIRSHKEAMDQSGEAAKDAVHELVLKSRVPFVTLASINWNFFYELEKFFPAAWQKLIAHRQQVMLPSIIKNLQRGVAEGLYREDLDTQFAALIRLQQITTALIRLQQITTALNPKDFTQTTTDALKLMNSLTEFYLHGIVTTKGKRLINTYLKNNNEDGFSK
jgi:AcrR family transcriptional regulator